MKSLSFIKIFLACVLTTFLFSCHKPSLHETISAKGPVKDQPNYAFDWESAASMPVSPDSPVQVYMPWSGQSGSYIDPGLMQDYHQVDGWNLVYDTFGPTVIPTIQNQPAGGLYFALYNRFKGLLRFYLYIPSGYFGSSTDIIHSLSVISKNNTGSKMLNFEGTDLTTATQNNPVVSKTNNNGVNASGGWYAMQYELAYDPTFASSQYSNLSFGWNLSTNSISNISLSGTQQGTITGDITTPASGFNWQGALSNLIPIAAEVVSIGASGFSNTQPAPLGSAAAGGLAGNITGFLSAVFGTSASSQTVDLKMNTTITLVGTQQTAQPLLSDELFFPGQAAVGDPAPLTTAPFGVFNLSSTPVVHINTTRELVTSDDGVYYQYVNLYTIDPGFSSLIQTNPAVFGPADGADFANLQTNVVLFNPSTNLGFQYYGGQAENFGNYNLLTGASGLTTQYLAAHSQPNPPAVGIRMSFDVVPLQGGNKVTIVKTFMANLVVN